MFNFVDIQSSNSERSCSAQTQTRIGLLEEIPRFPAFLLLGHLGVCAPYATRRKLRYEANQVWMNTTFISQGPHSSGKLAVKTWRVKTELIGAIQKWSQNWSGKRITIIVKSDMRDLQTGFKTGLHGSWYNGVPLRIWTPNKMSEPFPDPSRNCPSHRNSPYCP